MSLRIATYNVQNLFSRARVLELPGFSEKSRAILDDVAALCLLLAQPSYAKRTAERILRLCERYGLGRGRDDGWFHLNEVRGRLLRVGKSGRLELVARGRADWVGWVELTRGAVATPALENTARVLEAVAADVVCMVEVESRLVLDRFNRELCNGAALPFNMVVDGNDSRGIDVGILSRYEIRSVRSHIDDLYETPSGQPERIFSRDCAEYEVALPGGRSLHVLCNHFKSKGYGAMQETEERRRQQARRVRDLVSRFDLARDLVVVAGDLNDVPDGASLRDLVETPRLHDVLDALPCGAPRWTYRGSSHQIDYLLVSSPLRERIAAVGVERRGIWRARPNGLPAPFREVTDLVTQASDYAAVWAEIDL